MPRTGTPEVDAYMARAIGAYLLLSQDQQWNDIEGNTVRIDDMSVGYKRNVLRFLAKRATGLGSLYSFGQTMNRAGGGFYECAGPNGDGCGATHEWAHGVFHGAVYPGSEIESMYADEDTRTMEAVHADPIRWLYSTALGKRLRDDINARIGGHIQ